MTTRFYCPPSQVEGERLVLPPDEARHAVQVLRHGVGDDIEVVDGQGGWFRVRLEVANGTRVGGMIEERKMDVGESPYALVLGFGLIKNTSRLETLVEKAAELGVRRLVPLETARTERARLRQDRLERIAIAAMKQSGRSRLMQIDDVTALDAFLHEASGTRLICHEASSPAQGILSVLESAGEEEVCLAIGPEGGFANAEVQGAESLGFQVVHLGPRRLRAETAGMTAVAVAMAHLERRTAGAADSGQG